MNFLKAVLILLFAIKCFAFEDFNGSGTAKKNPNNTFNGFLEENDRKNNKSF